MTVAPALASILLLVPTFAACDSGGGGTGDPLPTTAAAYVGYWEVLTMVIPGQGGDTTFTHDGTPMRLVADIVVTSPADNTLVLSFQQAAIEGNLLVDALFTETIPVTLDAGVWLIGDDSGGGVDVYKASQVGATLTLERDPSDPRSGSGADAPKKIVVRKATMPSASIIGSWAMTSVTTAGQTATSGTCMPSGADRWGTVTGTVEITDRMAFTITQTLKRFSDDACATETTSGDAVATGLAALNGTTMEIFTWDDDDERASYLAFAMSLSGSDLSLTRSSCEPMPSCETDTPSAMEFVRQP